MTISACLPIIISTEYGPTKVYCCCICMHSPCSVTEGLSSHITFSRQKMKPTIACYRATRATRIFLYTAMYFILESYIRSNICGSLIILFHGFSFHCMCLCDVVWYIPNSTHTSEYNCV